MHDWKWKKRIFSILISHKYFEIWSKPKLFTILFPLGRFFTFSKKKCCDLVSSFAHSQTTSSFRDYCWNLNHTISIKAIQYLLFHTFLWMIAIVGCFGFISVIFGLCVCELCVYTVKFENMWPEFTSYVCSYVLCHDILSSIERVNLK